MTDRKPSAGAFAAASELYPAAKDWDYMRETDVAQASERAAVAPDLARVAGPLAEALGELVQTYYPEDMLRGEKWAVEANVKARQALAAYRRETGDPS